MKKGGEFSFFYGEEKQNLVGLLVENNFNKAFEPLTSENLRFFLPLNGTYLIDFQLHFFRYNEIKKIYIIVTHHEKELLQYIEEFQKRKKKYGDLDIEIIKMNKSIRTLGDVLRDFKKCVEIYTDVLLLLSDTIPIANIKDVIKAHSLNKQKWKNHIMTVFLTYADHNEKSVEDDFVIGYDNLSLKLLIYESLKKKKNLIITDELINGIGAGASDVDKKKEKNVEKEKKCITKSNNTNNTEINAIIDNSNENVTNKSTFYDMWNDSSCVKICYDMVLPNLFILTTKVFQLFEENFDYDCIHKDFIYNILNKKIKIEEIYVHVLNEDYNYAECNQIIKTLSDFRIYFQFFKTIVQRNTHPFISNATYLLPDIAKQSFTGHEMYKSKNCFVNGTCEVFQLASILSHTEIAEGVILENAFIGQNCKIGKNVKIKNSVICKNVIIGDETNILNSYISEDVIIGSNVLINEGCVVGKGMNIPSNYKTEKFDRFSLCKQIKQKGKKKESGNGNGFEKREDTINEDIESFDLKKHIIKTKYSETKLKLMSLTGNVELNLKIKIPDSDSSNTSDSSNLESDIGTDSEKALEEERNEASSIRHEKKKREKDKTKLGNEEEEEEDEDETGKDEDDEDEDEDESDEMQEDSLNDVDDVNDKSDINDLNNLKLLHTFHKKNNKRENYAFASEICILCKEAFDKPEYMSHKILEMKSYRLSLNYTDLDVLISFFPLFWNFLNTLEFDKNVWIKVFETQKFDLLFSSFLSDDKLYYETIYDLILKFSKIELLNNGIKNNIYGPDKLCSTFEYIYHMDIFEFNHFNEWVEKNGSDEYVKDNKRLKAFATWLEDDE